MGTKQLSGKSLFRIDVLPQGIDNAQVCRATLDGRSWC
jgi:hypothetical protein